MRLRLSEKGEGRLGCVIVAALLLAGAYLTIQVGPVYLNRIDFEEELTRITGKAGAEGWSERFIQEQIQLAAKARGFELTPRDIAVDRSARLAPSPRIRVRVTYRKAVDLPGYTHVFEFESEASSIVGRL
ncbi:MAG TPA: hypothetical protein VMN76_05370 [Acidobacteriota bacterium]|nr:hypothetical protein [Acidobacteriota bacterium]